MVLFFEPSNEIYIYNAKIEIKLNFTKMLIQIDSLGRFSQYLSIVQEYSGKRREEYLSDPSSIICHFY